MTRQPFSGNDQVSAFWRMARRSLSPLIDIRNQKGLRFSAAIVTLFFLSTVYAPAQSNSNSPLGTNLAEVSYFTSEQPFLNIFKTGASWSTRATSAINTDTGEEVALYQHFLDSNGYPTTLSPGAGYKFNAVSVLLLRALNSGDVTQPTFPAYQAGDYLLQWSGNGTWSYYFDAQGTCKTSPCKITISSPSGGGLWLILTSTTPGNTVKNVSLIYCGTWNGSACSNGYDTLLANGEMFNPTFINQIKAFKTLRFKDWMATADNFQTNWTDRPGENWVFWDGSRTNATINGASPSYLNDGVPAEVMFALCNEVEADCWFNMPPLATDDYVMQFATLAHSLLNRTSRVYVEYANEVWNQVFAPQQSGNTGAPLDTASVLLQLQALGHTAYPDLSGFSAAFQYGILRAVQVGADWKSAWGADAGRVIRLAAGQNGYPTRNNWILTSSPNGSNTCCGQKSSGGPTYWYGTTGGTVAENVDAFAVAPYFGYAVPDTLTVDQLFTEIMSGGVVSGGYPGGMIKQTLDFAATNYSLAQTAGLPLVAYEGGQSLVSISDTTLQALYAAANRDPRMGTAYTTFLSGWKNLGGGMFNNFTDIQQYSQWGYWGALENVLQTSSPKYNALTGFISRDPTTSNPATANTAPPSVPAGLAGTVASATQINLTWTASTGGVTGYNVFRNSAKVGTATSTSYQDASLAAGTTYSYSVSAHNASGATSAQSSSISVATPTPPKVVINSPVNGTVLSNGDAGITVSASGTGIAAITIKADGNTLQTCTNTASCSTSWANIARGVHTIIATATDNVGLTATSSVLILSLL